jgi:hypothetical protein
MNCLTYQPRLSILDVPPRTNEADIFQNERIQPMANEAYVQMQDVESELAPTALDSAKNVIESTWSVVRFVLAAEARWPGYDAVSAA